MLVLTSPEFAYRVDSKALKKKEERWGGVQGEWEEEVGRSGKGRGRARERGTCQRTQGFHKLEAVNVLSSMVLL